jgi:minor extracellular serine protease Vpr
LRRLAVATATMAIVAVSISPGPSAASSSPAPTGLLRPVARAGVADPSDAASHGRQVHSTWRPLALDPARKVTVVIELGSPPIAAREAKAAAQGRTLSDWEQVTARARLRARQEVLRPVLVSLGAQLLGQYQDAYDGIKVRLPVRDVALLERLPGVAAVRSVPDYRLANRTGDGFTGVPKAWATGGGLTGRGVKIGIIDAGIDYYHADFGGSGIAADFAADDGTTIGTPAFPNAKVAGGFDFVGDAYDSGGEGDALVPKPDADPLDCNGHGTHVAGTAAGFGVTIDGQTFHGPYDARTLSDQSFLIGPGVAPESQLYALRIFGCSGTTNMVVDAIDWAVKHHLDVISLSLGSPFGSSGSPDAVAANNAAAAGVVVVAAAGNDGPGAYISSSPGAAPRAIEVGAVDAVSTLPGATIAVGAGVAAINANVASGFPITGRLIVPMYTTGEIVLGCTADEYAGIQPGDIVVTRRGLCPRTDRARLAQAAGAAAVVMINDSDLDVFPPLEGPIDGVTIPMLGVKRSASPSLMIANGSTVTISGGLSLPNPAYRSNADFSSGGPSSSGGLKPDISAPGVSIFSAAVGTGTGGTRESGTSMATPHVAGVAALIRQAHPGWTPEQVKAAIMNTASAGVLAGYDPRLAGSGLVQPAAAVTTVALATTGSGTASLSYGPRTLNGPFAIAKTVRILNTSRLPITFRLTTAFVGGTLGTHATISPATVTVAAGKAVSVSVTLSLSAAAAASLPAADTPKDPRSGLTAVRGAVVITPTIRRVGVAPLRVPFLLLPRATSHIVSPPTVTLEPDSATGRDVGVATLANDGIRAGAADVYAWGLTAAATNAGSIDIRAVGVQSVLVGLDGLPLPPADPLIRFAVNTWQPWSSPATDEFDILINPDASGNPTYVVAALDEGLVMDGSPNGREGCFVVRASDLAITEAAFVSGPVNSTILRCGVRASDIGLTGGAFSYGVQAASLLSASTVKLPGTATFNPFDPSLSQGESVVLLPGQSGDVALWLDRSRLAASPALGWMLVSADNAVGPGQAATIPLVPSGP